MVMTNVDGVHKRIFVSCVTFSKYRDDENSEFQTPECMIPYVPPLLAE